MLCVGVYAHAAFFNRVDLKSLRLISFTPPTGCSLPLKLRPSIACYSNFNRCHDATCSFELNNCMPSLLKWSRCIHLSTEAHPYTVQISRARVNLDVYSFIPCTGKL